MNVYCVELLKLAKHEHQEAVIERRIADLAKREGQKEVFVFFTESANRQDETVKEVNKLCVVVKKK